MVAPYIDVEARSATAKQLSQRDVLTELCVVDTNEVREKGLASQADGIESCIEQATKGHGETSHGPLTKNR